MYQYDLFLVQSATCLDLVVVRFRLMLFLSCCCSTFVFPLFDFAFAAHARPTDSFQSNGCSYLLNSASLFYALTVNKYYMFNFCMYEYIKFVFVYVFYT